EAETCADRYNYLYKESELGGWKERVENIAEQAKITFVVANNHFEAKAGVNALQLKHMLTGRRVIAPESLIEHYPALRAIADPLEEGSKELHFRYWLKFLIVLRKLRLCDTFADDENSITAVRTSLNNLRYSSFQ